MKIKILITLLLWLNLMAFAGAQSKDKVQFSRMSIDRALSKAREEKKLLFVCIYSGWGYKLADNIEEILNKSYRRGALKTTLFVKILAGVKKDSTEYTTVTDEVGDFLRKYGLAVAHTGNYHLIFDQYGNLLDQLECTEWQPYQSCFANYKPAEVTNFLRKAQRKVQQIEKDFMTQYKKAEKLFKQVKTLDGIKKLNEIIDTEWQGYKLFEQAKQDLEDIGEISGQVNEALNEFWSDINDLKDSEEPKKEIDRHKKERLGLLGSICKTYEHSVFVQEVKNIMKLVEEDKHEELIKKLDDLQRLHPQELPSFELTKLKGEARITNDGWFNCDIYNTSEYIVSEIKVKVTFKGPDGNIKLSTECQLKPKGKNCQPGATITFHAKLGYSATKEDKWTWIFISAKGMKE